MKVRISLFLSFLYILLSCQLNAQTEFEQKVSESFQIKPKPLLRFNTRGSFIANRTARIKGVQVGLDFNKTIRLGIAYNWLSNSSPGGLQVFPGKEILRQHDIITPENRVVNTVYSKLRLSYVSLFAEYVFYKTHRWEMAIPIEFGFGQSFYRYFYNTIHTTPHYFCFTYETNLSGQYKVFPWLACGLGFGYRIMLAGNNMFHTNFNSPVYIIKIKVIPWEIIKISGWKEPK